MYGGVCVYAVLWLLSGHQGGFKMFLGVIPTVANWSSKGDEFSLVLDQNPLVDFVELPDDHPNLLYSNIICGVIRGALEMVTVLRRVEDLHTGKWGGGGGGSVEGQLYLHVHWLGSYWVVLR